MRRRTGRLHSPRDLVTDLCETAWYESSPPCGRSALPSVEVDPTSHLACAQIYGHGQRTNRVRDPDRAGQRQGALE